MTQEAVRALLGEIREVFTLPEVSVRIIQMLSDPDVGVKELHDVFKEDAALSSNLLRLANSAFYGFSHQVADVERAIVLLGLNAVKALAFTCSVRSSFETSVEPGKFSPRHLWFHSLAVGVIARRVFRKANLPNEEGVFLAGVIHDLGLLLENQCRPAQFEQVILAAADAQIGFLDVEREILDTDHCELGQALSEAWNFPAQLISVIARHHTPLEADEMLQPLTCAVAVASNMAGDLSFGFSDRTPADRLPPGVWDVLSLDPDTLDDVRDTVEPEVRSVTAILAV